MKNYNSIGTNLDEAARHAHYSTHAKHAIVELGVLNGETSKIFCNSNKNVPIYGIDPIIPDSMNFNLIGNYETIKNLEKQYSNYTFINDYSYNVVKTWDKPIDYLFIDGDHNYEAVKQDYESWVKHVVCNGIIAIHDSACYRNGPEFWPGPSKLADELIESSDLEYIETFYTMTIFKKI
jgi:hypothetical protein